MTIRTSSFNLNFDNPFYLDGLDEVQPAGLYDLELDEELIEGVSFLAYRKVAVVIYLNSANRGTDLPQPFVISPSELEEVVKRDREPKAKIAVW